MIQPVVSSCLRLALVLLLVAPTLDAASTPPGDDGPWVVRVRVAARADVDRLAAEFEPWSVRYDVGEIVLDVDSSGWRRLVEMGFDPQIDAGLSAEVRAPRIALPGQTAGIPGFPCYRTVEETYATAAALVAAYPTLATWFDIGDSWDKVRTGGAPGYDIMLLRLTNSAVSGPKPRLLLNAAIHAREYTPAEVVTRFAEQLLAGYGTNADTTWMLDHHEVHLILQGNPDGRKRAEAGTLWRRNTDSDFCATPSAQGIDLNRNFPYLWGCCGGSSANGCSETYRGPSAASEPEAQALRNYMLAIFPDYGDPQTGPIPASASGLFIDMHSSGQLVMWPWGYTGAAAPNGTQMQTLGRRFAYFNQHTPFQANNLYTTDGTTRDFGYGELGVPSYTFELGTAFFQDCASFQSTILPRNLEALVYALRVARAGYALPAGPDALSLATLPPVSVNIGQPLQVSATLDDTRFGGSGEPVQTIAAAEVYVDTPPWAPGAVAVAMQAADGAFDETVDPATVTLSTAGWSIGRHTLFVRGRDAASNFGPVSAVFVDVTTPVELQSFRVE
jgi:predicted deacylase